MLINSRTGAICRRSSDGSPDIDNHVHRPRRLWGAVSEVYSGVHLSLLVHSLMLVSQKPVITPTQPLGWSLLGILLVSHP